MACPPGARLFHFHYPEVGPAQKGKIQIVRSEESSPRGRDSLGSTVGTCHTLEELRRPTDQPRSPTLESGEQWSGKESGGES